MRMRTRERQIKNVCKDIVYRPTNANYVKSRDIAERLDGMDSRQVGKELQKADWAEKWSKYQWKVDL